MPPGCARGRGATARPRTRVRKCARLQRRAGSFPSARSARAQAARAAVAQACAGARPLEARALQRPRAGGDRCALGKWHRVRSRSGRNGSVGRKRGAGRLAHAAWREPQRCVRDSAYRKRPERRHTRQLGASRSCCRHGGSVHEPRGGATAGRGAARGGSCGRSSGRDRRERVTARSPPPALQARRAA